MSSQSVKSYAFDVSPRKLQPVLDEPAVQTALAVLAHVSIVATLVKTLIELLGALNVTEALGRIARGYIHS